MIWTALTVIGVLLILIAAYVLWILFKARAALGKFPKAFAEILADRIRVTVSFPDADTKYQITEALLSRETGETLGISAPDDFSLEPYTLDDTLYPTREESIDWVKAANSKEIRWVGRRPLTPDADTILDFPFENEAPGKVVFRFQYERKLGMGGQISFFDVSVEPGTQ